MTQHIEETSEKIREHYDSGEFPLSSLRRIAVNRPGQPQEAFALRLPPTIVEELRAQAETRDMGVTQLVREWVIERLELERRRPAISDPVLWERTRAVIEEMLPEIVAQVSSPSGKDSQ